MTLDSKKICIIGTGGFARETLCCLIDILSPKQIDYTKMVCFMEEDAHYNESEIMGIPVIKQSSFDPTSYHVVIAIGDPIIRKKVATSLPSNTTYISVIHPNAIISEWVEVGEGSIITAGTILTCNIKLGKHTHLNLNTTVGHDCVVGDYFTTAPSANISGNCTFGECVYFGTSSSVRQGINICDHVTIGMGAVVVKHIQEPGVYVGSPAKKLER